MKEVVTLTSSNKNQIAEHLFKKKAEETRLRTTEKMKAVKREREQDAAAAEEDADDFAEYIPKKTRTPLPKIPVDNAELKNMLDTVLKEVGGMRKEVRGMREEVGEVHEDVGEMREVVDSLVVAKAKMDEEKEESVEVAK